MDKPTPQQVNVLGQLFESVSKTMLSSAMGSLAPSRAAKAVLMRETAEGLERVAATLGEAWEEEVFDEQQIAVALQNIRDCRRQARVLRTMATALEEAR